MTDIIFHSKIDTWLAIVLLGASLLLILLPLWEWRYHVDNSFNKNMLITVLTVPFAILLLLPLINTKYTLSNDELLVHNGFYSSSISLTDINSITPTRNSISAPALSLDRIEIQYSGGSTLVSPKDKQAFYQALQQRDPALKMDNDNTGLIRK